MPFDVPSYLLGKQSGGGGGGDVTVESKSITSNGTYTAPTGKAYSPVTVNVANSYAAGDEGKVVSSGALVSQTAHAEVTQNGTIDTTLNNSVVVNVSGGGGSSPWTKLAEQDFTVSTTSTTATSVGTISCGAAAWTAAKMLYVRVRDKAGKRNGYYYGGDFFLVNINPANNSTGAATTFIRYCLNVNTKGLWGSSASTLGIYPTSLSLAGDITMSSAYSSNSTRTIDGTYHVEVYTLEWPDNVSPFA